MTVPLLGTANALPGRSSPASTCQNHSARPRSMSVRRCMMAVIGFFGTADIQSLEELVTRLIKIVF
jgi:hypothetical protein